MTFFSIRIYRQYITGEGHRSVRKLWSFYCINVSQLRFIYVLCLYIYINSKKICTGHFNSNDFMKKCDVSVLLVPSTGDHIKVYIYMCTFIYVYIYIYIYKKCMKSICQICNIIDTRARLKIPGTNITVRPGNYYCNSSNVIYLIKCKKCDSGNYIGETSTFLRLRMNNHKKSIRDNNKGLPVARHFNKPDHIISDHECVILNGDFSNNADRLIDEQTLIR